MRKIEMLNAQIAAMESINMYFMREKGRLIDIKKLALSFDHYEQADEHTWGRFVRKADDIIHPDEEIWRSLMHKINFEENTVLITNITGPHIYDQHYHVEQETIYVGSGYITENVNGLTIRAGQHLSIKPMQPHIIEAHGPCQLLVTLYPPAFNAVKHKAS